MAQKVFGSRFDEEILKYEHKLRTGKNTFEIDKRK